MEALLWLILIFVGICAGIGAEIKIITKKQRNEARRYLDTLASNWSRMEAEAIKEGNDCFLCWQAQSLVNLAFITNGYEYAEEIGKRIGMITDNTLKGCKNES